MSEDGRLRLVGATQEDLATLFDELGEPTYRARQLYRQIYVRGVTDLDAMTDLSKALRRTLGPHVRSGLPEIAEVLEASDGTRKILLRLHDGRTVESVLIPMSGDGEPRRSTLCMSTQVGCTLDCRFCLTASLGLLRNMSAGEIVSQVLVARTLLKDDERLTRYVFMGMGEPLANYGEVVASLALMGDHDGMCISGRRITVSTAGMANRIPSFGRDTDAMLAVSINATTDEQRAEIMPRVHGRFPLDALLDACRRFPMPRRRRLTFEYVLLSGVNDTDADAKRLVSLVHGIPAKVNLIPYNPHPASPYKRPPRDRIDAFRRVLLDSNVATSVRVARGDDVLAACGQLGALSNASAGGSLAAPVPHQ